MKCFDCPRMCGADRAGGRTGVCHGGYYARIAKIIEDFGYEEPCLGEVTAVFFGGCALGCTYCQNIKISRGSLGAEYDDSALSRLFDGADRPLDLVTPSHYITAIERALALCKSRPRIIYNTSGYETPEAVARAAAFTSVFLADYKYGDEQTGKAFSRAADYHYVALRAIVEMRRAVSDVWRDSDKGRALERGLIVRHLVLPGQVKNSIAALDKLAAAVGTDVVLSLMSQFTPNGVGEPSVPLNKIEYKLVVEHALKLGFGTGYVQDFTSATNKYTPDF